MSSKRERLPNRRSGIHVTVNGQDGFPAILTTGNYSDGRCGEIFVNYQKEGSFASAALNAFAIAMSLGLQHGVPLEAFIKSFKHHAMNPDLVREIMEELERAYTKCSCEADYL